MFTLLPFVFMIPYEPGCCWPSSFIPRDFDSSFCRKISFSFSWVSIQFDSIYYYFCLFCLLAYFYLFQASSKLPAFCDTCNAWCWFCPSNVLSYFSTNRFRFSRKCIRKCCAHIFVTARDSEKCVRPHDSFFSGSCPILLMFPRFLSASLFLTPLFSSLSPTSHASCHPDFFFFLPLPFTLFLSRYSFHREDQSWEKRMLVMGISSVLLMDSKSIADLFSHFSLSLPFIPWFCFLTSLLLIVAWDSLTSLLIIIFFCLFFSSSSRFSISTPSFVSWVPNFSPGWSSPYGNDNEKNPDTFSLSWIDSLITLRFGLPSMTLHMHMTNSALTLFSWQ